jgi:hypothetical protein
MPKAVSPTIIQSNLSPGLIKAKELKVSNTPETLNNVLVSIVRKNHKGENEILLEYGSEYARVFANLKAAKRWIKRNVVSPNERAKYSIVRAERS